MTATTNVRATAEPRMDTHRRLFFDLIGHPSLSNDATDGASIRAANGGDHTHAKCGGGTVASESPPELVS
jgi:hypothetical protein